MFFKAFLVMFLLLVALASPACAHKHKPKRLVFYVHEATGTTPEAALNATARVITTSNAGALFVLNQPLTEEGPSPASRSVGYQCGTSSGVGNVVDGSLVLFVACDLHLKTEQYTGTVAVQGAADVAALGPLTLPILGGTGDFYLARGYCSVTFVEGDAFTPTGVLRHELHFVFGDL